MPRDPTEGQPLEHEGKMDDETRKETFGGSGREQGPGAMSPEEREGVARHSATPSESGSNKNAGGGTNQNT